MDTSQAETIGAEGGTKGGAGFRTALLLALGGWAGCVLLQLALYLRPAPHGGPFLVEWQRYFGLALYYDLLGVWLLSLPFFLIWLVGYRRRFGRSAFRLLCLGQGLLLALNLAVSQMDHEVMRYLGIRLTPSFLATYAQPQMLADSLFGDLLAADRGGPFLSIVLLAVAPALFLWWAARLVRRPPRPAMPLWLALLFAAVPVAAPGNAWLQATSQFRLRKVEPVAVAFAVDIHQGFGDFARPAGFDRMAAEHRRSWLARSTDPSWAFPDPAHPYFRVPLARPGAAAAETRWNVIYIQLETLRGMDTGFLRPDRGPSPTLSLDRLARSGRAAAWSRVSSFGMPSINGLFATHCSVVPHSRRYITAFTHVRFSCLPEMLRRRGWRLEMFNGGDTDWDNSSPWIGRWYDRLWRFPEARQEDRAIFRAAAARLRTLGRSGRPFFAAIVSVTNHTPFRSPEPALNVAGETEAADRILNTTHYTDRVLGEFLAAIEQEPWFGRTILVVTGDHGFNTGEHGQVPGQHDLHRESLWVPLVVAGSHPRLRPGLTDVPASLLDVAPTIADLLGIREANAWQGHSLLAVNRAGRLAFGIRDVLAWESDAWSALVDPADRVRLYASQTDWLQHRDLAPRRSGLARRLIEAAERSRQFNDYLLRHDLLLP